ncbi:MAG: hypothetical protein ACYDA8_23500 [Deferrisomatales bacterium]
MTAEALLGSAAGIAVSLVKILAEIAAGVYLGQLVEALGWTGRLGRVFRPLLGLGRLPAQVGVSFATAFASGSAANSALVGWRDQGRLTERQMAVAAVLNSFPNQVNHLPSQVVPLALLVGPRVAAAYFGVQVGAGLARTAAALLWARLFPGPAPTPSSIEPPAPSVERRAVRLPAAAAAAWRSSSRTLRRVVKITLPVCALVMVLGRAGAFDGLEAWLGRWPGLAALGPQAGAVIAAHWASLLTAGAAAAELLRQGALDERSAALVLLVGSLVAMPWRTLRHSLGLYVGVFGPTRGGRILALTQGLRFLFGGLGVAALALLWR